MINLGNNARVDDSGNIILPKTEGICIKRNLDTPTCTWKDLIGEINIRDTGATIPTYAVFRGNIRAYRFTSGDDMDFVFHVPHDWIKGTDFYIHSQSSNLGTPNKDPNYYS